MKKGISIVAILMLVCSLSVFFVACDKTPSGEKAEVRGFTDKDNQYLVKYDDFDNGTLDKTLWNVYGEDKGNTPHIRRGAYWDPRQVIVENNALVIRTQKREDGYYYTGAIDSHNKFESGYGYYEARCKLPKASGLWSAFWLMSKQMEEGTAPGTSDVSKTGAEIDIMESPYYGNGLFDYQFNVHVGDYDQNYTAYSKLHPLKNMVNYSALMESEEELSIYDDWHTFGLEWTDSYYKFYMDRMLVCTVTDASLISPLEGFLFLSIEVDGATKTLSDGTQVPDAFPNLFAAASMITSNTDDTFPVDFLVDWVAVYSQKPF